MEQLEKIAVIAYFVEGQQTSKTLLEWIGDLGRELQEDLKVGQRSWARILSDHV
jgi:hypothetical protein